MMGRSGLGSRALAWYQDGDPFVVTASFTRPDGVVVRRYVRTIQGPYVTFTARQAEAKRFLDRGEGWEAVLDVRLVNRQWHPVRLVRLVRMLEDRESEAIPEGRGTPQAGNDMRRNKKEGT